MANYPAASLMLETIPQKPRRDRFNTLKSDSRTALKCWLIPVGGCALKDAIATIANYKIGIPRLRAAYNT